MTPYRENIRAASTVIRIPGARAALYAMLVFVAVLGLVGAMVTAGSTEVSCDRALGVPRCTAVDHRLYAREVRATIASRDVVGESTGSDDNVHWTLRLGNTTFEKGVDEAFAKRVASRVTRFFADEKSPDFSESRYARAPLVCLSLCMLVGAVIAWFASVGAVVVGDRANNRVGISNARLFRRGPLRWIMLDGFERADAVSTSGDGSEVLLHAGSESKPIFSGEDSVCRDVARTLNALRGSDRS